MRLKNVLLNFFKKKKQKYFFKKGKRDRFIIQFDTIKQKLSKNMDVKCSNLNVRLSFILNKTFKRRFFKNLNVKYYIIMYYKMLFYVRVNTGIHTIQKMKNVVYSKEVFYKILVIITDF